MSGVSLTTALITVGSPSFEAINFAVAVEADVDDVLLGVAQESAAVRRAAREVDIQNETATRAAVTSPTTRSNSEFAKR